MRKKLYVGNLNWDTEEEGLKQHFEQIGEVEEAIIIRDRRKGNRSKGFGFVTMSSEEDAEKAIDELDGVDLEGRELKVSVAKPKSDDDTTKSSSSSTDAFSTGF
jgi:RNA recognition motif-containing protein